MKYAMMNVDGSLDPTYRYKMPRMVVTTVESKGGLTRLTNTEALAKSLYRTPEQLRGHFTSDLKMSVRLIPEGSVQVLQFPGKLALSPLQASLTKYIQNNVLCVTCRCPETKMDLGKISCSACGANRILKK